MIRDVDERGRLAPGLTWLGAGALALALHVGVFAAVFRQPEPATMATGGDSTVEVDLEPVEGEKSPDDMPPPESSGDPTEAAAAAADSAAAADAPATPPIVPRPPDLPLPPPLRPAPPTPSAQPPSQPPPPEPATPAALPPPSDPELPKRIPEATPPETPEPPPPEAVPLQPPPSVSPPTEPASMSSEPPPPPPKPVPPTRPEPPKLEALFPAPEVPPAGASAASGATAASEEAAPTVQKLSAGREAVWRGKLVGHLNRFRRFPPGFGSGTARVGFTIDAAGRVTEVRIISGSGNAALDDAARALIVKASPFPTPPAGLSGKSLSFVVPVHFDVHRP